MQKHRKHVRRWPKLAAAAAALGASLAMFLVPTAQAATPAPDPMCDTHGCTWLMAAPGNATDTFEWSRASGPAANRPSQIWLTVQNAPTAQQDAWRYRMRWLGPESQLTLSFDNGTATASTATAVIASASTDPNNALSYDGNTTSDMQISSPGPVTGAEIRIEQVFVPGVTTFMLTTGSGDLSATGHIEFSEPIADFQPWDLIPTPTSNWCYITALVVASDALSADFEVRGCRSATAGFYLRKDSVVGLQPGNLSGPPVNSYSNEVQVAAVVAPSPTVTPTPTPSASSSPSPTAPQSPVPDPTATSQEVVPPPAPEPLVVAPPAEPAPTPTEPEPVVAPTPVAPTPLPAPEHPKHDATMAAIQAPNDPPSLPPLSAQPVSEQRSPYQQLSPEQLPVSVQTQPATTQQPLPAQLIRSIGAGLAAVAVTIGGAVGMRAIRARRKPKTRGWKAHPA